MSRKHWILFCFSWLAACDGTEGAPAGADAGAEGCVQSDLIAQCPLASNPILGNQAEAACTSAVGGVVEDAEGQATAQCYGVGGCRVMCQFQVPCRCGVASVGRDGVLCAPCDDAASCGNGRCEGGENPQNCPIDCGAVCNPGETRCNGEQLQECSLQGRFETLACPATEVCGILDGSAQCIRDPDILVGGDAGVGDAGPPPDDGRLYPGEGTWPVVADVRTAPLPRGLAARTFELGLESGRPNGGSSLFGGAMALTGTERISAWYPRGNTGEIEGFGATATVRLGPDGSLVERSADALPPIDVAGYCERAQRCEPALTDEVCREYWLTLQEGSEWWRRCLAATYDATGVCSSLFAQDATCRAFYSHPYPADFQVARAGPLRVGNRLLGETPARDRLAVLDLDTGVVVTLNPLPGFTLSDRRAFSADGRIVAVVATQGSDEVVVWWNTETSERRPILPLSVGQWGRIALSPDGQVLAAYLSDTGEPRIDGGVSLYNTATEARIVTIRPLPQSAIGANFIDFSASGRLLALDMGGEIEVWALATLPERIQTLSLNGARPGSGRFAPDGVTLVAEFGQLTWWDAETGQRWRTQPIEGGEAVRGFGFSADGQRMVVLTQLGLTYRFQVLSP